MTKSNAAPTPHRLSDLRVAVYGGGRFSNELAYLKGQNGDASGINNTWADAWDRFAGAQGVTSVTRPTEKRRLFMREGNYP